MCGPYPVMEVLAGNNYQLHMPDNPRRFSRLHVNMLEKYVTPIAECLWTDEDLKDLGNAWRCNWSCSRAINIFLKGG